MPRTFPHWLARFLALLLPLAQAFASSASADTAWMDGKMLSGRHEIAFHCARTMKIGTDTVRLFDTVKLGSWYHDIGFLRTSFLHRGSGMDSTMWIAESAQFLPKNTLGPWEDATEEGSRFVWRNGKIFASQPHRGAVGHTRGLWKGAILNVFGEVRGGKNLLPAFVGDSTLLTAPTDRSPTVPFVWKVPPGLTVDSDSFQLPPLCTLALTPTSPDASPGVSLRWLDSTGKPLEKPMFLPFKRGGPFPTLFARQGSLDWIIETDSTNFCQPRNGDIRGTVRIRPFPGQPFLPAGKSILQTLYGRFDTAKLENPITRIHPDGWEESILTAGWVLTESREGSLRSAAGSRQWAKGARSFRAQAPKDASSKVEMLQYHRPDLARMAPDPPRYGNDWAVDSFTPPLHPDVHFPWKASPPLWDTSSRLEVPGMGTARLDPHFWWTSPDTVEILAKIVLDSNWRRVFDRETLLVWNRFHRPLQQILTDTSPWRPRICDFRIHVNEYQGFPLADSSYLKPEDKPLFWVSSCTGDSMSMRMEGWFLKGSIDRSSEKPSKRYRGAIATEAGITFDSGSTRSQILSRTNGITFTVDDVDQKERLKIESDSGWIDGARWIAAQGIRRSFSGNDEESPTIDAKRIQPVAGRRGSLPLVEQGKSPFAGTFLLAWYQHLPVRLSPDQIWMAILDGVSLHIAKEPKKWRQRLKIGHSGKRELRLILDPDQYLSRNSPAFWETISARLLEAMPDSTQHLLEEHFLAKYTTTTPVAEVAYRMKILESVQPFFEYQGSVECGIPRITLEGTAADWIQLRTRARRLGKLGFTKWMNALDPILTQFVRASEGAPELSFWKSFFRSETSGGCDIVYEANGWITRFFPLDFQYDEFRFRKNLSSPLDLRFVPMGAGSFPFSLVDRTQPSLPTHHYRIVSGFVGVAQDSATGDLSPDIGWAVFEDSTGGR
ncbi:MAG: DUF4419 domain-containing protein [Fibrobacterota bacterium]|nr:MAG: DUF4419 domain-containing protein [Fibrobacterota bacterium]